MNNKYVVTGGPSVGKTTLLEEFEKRGFETVPESARYVIDEGIKTGLNIDQIRSDEEAFQVKVLHKKAENENRRFDKPTFFDRGMHDTVAYFKAFKLPVTSVVIKAVSAAKYEKVFLLEPLAAFEKDYARTESPAQARKIQQLLYEAYEEYGMPPIRVPAMSVAKRIEFILQEIDGDTTLKK